MTRSSSVVVAFVCFLLLGGLLGSLLLGGLLGGNLAGDSGTKLGYPLPYNHTNLPLAGKLYWFQAGSQARTLLIPFQTLSAISSLERSLPSTQSIFTQSFCLARLR